ncbi:MAG: hypothetical protein QW112_03285 [Candidatus Micrarchaeia archaeon]
MAIKNIVERFESVIETETSIRPDKRVSFFEMLTPAFIGGIVIGLIAGIPGLSIFIVLYPIGGYIAARFVVEFYEKKIAVRDAAKVGAFAGMIGGFFASLLLLMVSIFLAESSISFFRSTLGVENAELILTLSGIDPYVSLYTMRIRFLFNMVTCTILGALGGVVYAIRGKK